jgi:hypothetical protein
MEAENVLVGFKETPPNFPPTYKFVRGLMHLLLLFVAYFGDKGRAINIFPFPPLFSQGRFPNMMRSERLHIVIEFSGSVYQVGKASFVRLRL